MASSRPDIGVIVVGAGAAGLLAAISSAEAGARTVLLDRRRKIGAKILISGGTRCNVTNREVNERDFNTPSGPFVRNILRSYPPDRLIELLAQNGLRLKLEPTGKYFPVTDSARDVLAALVSALDRSGAELRREVLVEGARANGDTLVVETHGGELTCGALVLATGGLSFPETGSDGVGYGIARSFGHTIVRTSPALTPLVARPATHAELSGIAVPAELTLRADGRIAATRRGALLFTHTGYSGPVALDISRHWIRRGWASRRVELTASLLPDTTRDAFEARWLDEARRAPTLRAANLLAALMPERLADRLVRDATGSVELALGRATRAERSAVLDGVLSLRLPVTDVAGYGKAEVTAGGVPLSEVVARTMASKREPRLHFAGEILDVDGYIGGFNFQWAWSSGWVAGRAAAATSWLPARSPGTPS